MTNQILKTVFNLLIVSFLICGIIEAQVVQQWAERFNGTGNSFDRGNSVVVDPETGNAYVTGFTTGLLSGHDFAAFKYSRDGGLLLWSAFYNGTANGNDEATAIAEEFDGSEFETVYVTGFSFGTGTNNDITTIQYNSSGQQQWVSRYNGTANGEDGATCIAIDHSYVIVAGFTTDIGEGKNFVTMKYRSDGNIFWVRKYNGPGNGTDIASSLAVDGAGNVYVTGKSFGNATDYDYATIKYDANGNPSDSWADVGFGIGVRRYNGPGNGIDQPNSVKVEHSGNVFVTGFSTGNGTGYDFATIKYTSGGAAAWVKRYNGTANGNDEARSLALDADGSAFVAGYATANGDLKKFTTIKYDGSQQWVAEYDSVGEAYSIALDDFGNVYVAGKVGTVNDDYLTLKYSSSGIFQWAQRHNGPGNRNDYASSIAVKSDNTVQGPQTHVFVTGSSFGGLVTGDDFTTVKYFNQEILPLPPVLVSPVYGDTIRTLTTVLDWNDVPTALTYRVQVSFDTNFTTLVFDRSNIAASEITIPENTLVYNSPYFWRVNAVNQAGPGNWATSKFHTLPYPIAPSLISPPNGDTNQTLTPNLQWSYQRWAESFKVQIAYDANFNSLVLDSSGNTVPNMSVPDGVLRNQTLYFWRVNATNAAGTSGWSNPFFNFTTIMSTLPQPVLLYPVYGDTVRTLTETLDWNDVPGADRYRVQVDTSTSFNPPILNVEVMGQSSYAFPPQILSYNNHYYWRVNASNAAGGPGPWSTASLFFTLHSPDAPILLSPPNGAFGQPRELTLDWNDAPRAEIYRVIIGRDSNFTNIFLDSGNIHESQLHVTGLANSTQYFWKVNASNQAGSNWSDRNSFTTITCTVQRPVLISPQNGSTGQPLTPTLDWSDVPGAIGYAVQVARNLEFTDIVLNRDSLPVSQFTIPPGLLGTDTTYYWRANAQDPGCINWSDAFYFETIRNVPTQPLLLSPPNGAQGQPRNPTLDWNDVETAERYRVQVSTDANFNSRILDSSGITQSQFTVPADSLRYGTEYFWHVKAVNGVGWGTWSATFSFTVRNTVLIPPVLLTPLNGATNQTLILNLDWTDVQDAESYCIQISTDSNFKSRVLDSCGCTISMLTVSAGILGYSTTYFWRVSGINSGGPGPWSLPYSFTTESGAARLGLTVIPGGFFNTGTSKLNMRDTMRVLLIDSATCTIVNSAAGVIDSSTFNSTFTFADAQTGNYYIVVLNRNHIPICSRFTQNIIRNSTVNYDFTGDSAQTFGFNVIKLSDLPARWGMIPGDANSDGYVDGLDQTVWIGQNGLDGYREADFNGDGFVDGLDQTIWINRNGASSNLPCMIGNGRLILKKEAGTDVKYNELPKEFKLSQNFPNPFNPVTKIKFEIPVTGGAKNPNVKLTIYDILGREVVTLVNQEMKAGSYLVEWNASNYPSGAYFYRIVAGDYVDAKKMILLK